jgi:hypothetical protein
MDGLNTRILIGVLETYSRRGERSNLTVALEFQSVISKRFLATMRVKLRSGGGPPPPPPQKKKTQKEKKKKLKK